MLFDELNDDLKAAMKSRDATAVGALRMALTAVRHAELAAPGETPGDDAVRTVLAAEVRRRNEAAEIYENNGRAAAAASERAEAEVLAAYLPAELTDDEVAGLIDEAVAATGASSMADMGAVMRVVKEAAQGRADGARLAAAVKARLTG